MSTIYERALDFIHEGATVGLGSGKASTEFIKLLGARIQEGFRVKGGVPTSEASGQLARELGIPLLPLADAMPIDVAVDGADEWTDALDLVKGWGRALVREKIVEAASRKFVVLVGPGKHVDFLGRRGKIPIEIIPLAEPLVRARIKDEFGWEPVLWGEGGRPARTDNGNWILDCAVPPDKVIRDPAAAEARLLAIPGVVGTGLFVGMAHVLLLGDDKFELTDERLRAGL